MTKVSIISGFLGAGKTTFIKKLLEICDVLIDGPYIEEQRNLLLKFRGSENQRLIDLKKSQQEPFVIS